MTTKLNSDAPVEFRHTSIWLEEDKMIELADRAERLTGLRPSQSVLVRRAFKLLDEQFDLMAARLNGTRAEERTALRDAALAR